VGSALRWATITGNLDGSQHFPVATVTGIHYRTIESHVAYATVGIGAISIILGLLGVALMTAALVGRSRSWVPPAAALCGSALVTLSVRAVVDIDRARSGPFRAHPDAGVWLVVIGGAVIVMAGLAQLWAAPSPDGSGIQSPITKPSPT
jgi:hypothetical protein